MAIVDSARAGLHAIELGATIVQLRGLHLTGRDLEREAMVLVPKSSVPVIVSSRCDIALAAGAAGVNLRERDVPVAAARKLLGQRLIGRSVHSSEGAREAEQAGADFVIFGPVWDSPSHAGQPPQGLEGLTKVVNGVRIPVLAIGGVDTERAQECITAGAQGYAGIRMFE